MRKITTTYKQFYDLLKAGDKTKYYVKTPTGFSKINAACEKSTDTYYIEFENNLSFIVGDRHMFMDRNGNPIAAMDFKYGDVIQTEKGLLRVKSKSFHKKNELMYDISIDAPHWYISDESDGIYHHNTMLGFYGVKAYLDRYPEAVCLFYDSEFGANQGYFDALNIDTDRIIHIPVTNIEELKFDIVQRLEEIERGDKVFIMIDSIGNLASKREVENALSENSAADMTRAKEMKSFFRIVTPHITMKDIPCIIINHVYKETGMFAKTVVSGGCIIAETKILMSDGSYKKIQDITVGEEVKTLLGNKIVTHTWNPETLINGTPECYEITFNDGFSVICSDKHKFLTKNKEWKEARNIKIGDSFVKEDGYSFEVTNIKNVGKKEVYDISVSDAEHYILENGLITHNTGVMYSANTVFIITKAQEKVGSDIVGYNFTINIEKSRFVREKSKMTFQVLWDSGINKYSGLLDIALESGNVTKPSQGWYSRVNKETGEVEDKKYRLKDTYTSEFWDDILKDETFKEYIRKHYMIGQHSQETTEKEKENAG